MASISERGGVWRAQVRKAGKPSISQTFDTRTAAFAWAAAYETKEPEIIAGPVTLADLMDRYSTEVSPNKAGGRWEVIRIMAMRPSFTEIEAISLDRATIAQWRDGRLKQVSPATVNREWNLLSAVMTHAISEWRLERDDNPFRMVKRPKHPAHRTRRVTDEERAMIIKELCWDGVTTPDDLRQWVGWGFLFALETMMRTSEVLRLTRRHVRPKSVHLPRTKNGDARDVPLNSRARALLALLPKGLPDDKVCPVAAGTFGAYFRAARDSATIENMRFHDTRREAMSRSAKKLDILELMRAVGHRDTRSLGIYYQTDADELADKLG